MKKKKKIVDFVLILIFIFGLSFFLYPFISDWYYTIDQIEEVNDFNSNKKEIDISEIERRIQLAQAYNDSLLTNAKTYEDPYSGEAKRLIEAKIEYARMLEINEKIGHIKIPKILVDIPIYAGTTENVLQKGVGHMENTSLPVGGNNVHTVLTAHTGLPKAKLFTDIDKLEVGDRFYIYNIKEVLAYQIDQIKVVEPHDFNDLVIFKGHDYVTLLTCTPYMVNTHRLLVRGHRVEYVQQVEEQELQDNKTIQIYKYLFYITLTVLILVLIWIISKRKKISKK